MSFFLLLLLRWILNLILTPSCRGINEIIFFSVELLFQLLIGINIRQYSIQQHVSYRQSSCMHLLLSRKYDDFFFVAAASAAAAAAPPPPLCCCCCFNKQQHLPHHLNHLTQRWYEIRLSFWPRQTVSSHILCEHDPVMFLCGVC